MNKSTKRQETKLKLVETININKLKYIKIKERDN